MLTDKRTSQVAGVPQGLSGATVDVNCNVILLSLLCFGFGRDVLPPNLKVDPYKYQFFKKK